VYAREPAECHFDETISTANDAEAPIAACKTRLAANPNDIDARLTLGRLEIQIHDFSQGERDLSAVIALDPDRAQAWANRCNARLMQQNVADAMPDCTHAIALDPAEPGPYFARGEMDVLRNEYAAGLDDIDHAIARAPKRPPLFDYWRAKADYGLHRWADTIDDITRYAAQVDNDPEAFRLRAGAQINLNRFAPAVDDLKRAKAIYIQTGDTQRAAPMDELIAKFSAPQ